MADSPTSEVISGIKAVDSRIKETENVHPQVLKLENQKGERKEEKINVKGFQRKRVSITEKCDASEVLTGKKAQIFEPVTRQDVDYVKEISQLTELYNFDTWVIGTYLAPLDTDQKKFWLRKVYPEFFQRWNNLNDSLIEVQKRYRELSRYKGKTTRQEDMEIYLLGRYYTRLNGYIAVMGPLVGLATGMAYVSREDAESYRSDKKLNELQKKQFRRGFIPNTMALTRLFTLQKDGEKGVYAMHREGGFDKTSINNLTAWEKRYGFVDIAPGYGRSLKGERNYPGPDDPDTEEGHLVTPFYKKDRTEEEQAEEDAKRLKQQQKEEKKKKKGESTSTSTSGYESVEQSESPLKEEYQSGPLRKIKSETT